MRVHRRRHRDFFFQVRYAQEWQLKHGDHAVLVAMIACAELCHFKRTDGNAVQVFPVVGQTAIADVERELSTGLFADEFGELFDMLGEGAALAPERDIPFGCQRFGRESCNEGGRTCAGEQSVHGVLPVSGACVAPLRKSLNGKGALTSRRDLLSRVHSYALRPNVGRMPSIMHALAPQRSKTWANVAKSQTPQWQSTQPQSFSEYGCSTPLKVRSSH